MLVYAHGALVATYTQSGNVTNYCGLAATDAVIPVTINLPTHTSPSLVLRITSNLTVASSTAWFGLTNVSVVQFTPVWPPLDTFASGGNNNNVYGWAISGAGTLAITGCGGFGDILGGYEKFVRRGRWDKMVHV